MIPIRNASEVLEAIERVKRGARDFRTNFYSPATLGEWTERGELVALERAGTFFLMRRDRDFWRLHFAAADVEALDRGLSELEETRSERLVVDLISKTAESEDVKRLFIANGFQSYARLQRMSRGNDSAKMTNDERIALAASVNATAVLKLIETCFDRYRDQVPSLSEVAKFIAEGRVLVVNESGGIAGALVFETQGVTSLLRFLAVTPTLRKQGFGSALLREYRATQTGVKRFLLWVATDNVEAVRQYERPGFAADGLVDDVLVRGILPA